MNSLTSDRKNYGKHMIEIGILIMIANILTAIFIWQSILAGWKIVEGSNIFQYAFLQENQLFYSSRVGNSTGYLLLLRLLFSFFGNQQSVVVGCNILLQFLGLFLFYRGSRKLSGVKKALIFLFLAAIVSAAFPVTSDSPLHFSWMVLGFLFYLYTSFVSKTDAGFHWKRILFSILFGGVAGAFCSLDLIGILIFVLVLTFFYKNKKEGALILSSMLFLFLFLCVSFYSSSGAEAVFFKVWFQNQKLFYFAGKESLDHLIGISIMMAAYPVIHFVKFIKKIQTQETHKSEIPVKNDDSKKTPVENSGEEQEIKLIENPLPMPKKHVRKVMDYAFEPPKEQMYYDLNNYDVTDDYDLK